MGNGKITPCENGS